MEPNTHFHIRWSSATQLDWKPFETREEAREFAKVLARPGETFTLEARNGTCEKCAAENARLK